MDFRSGKRVSTRASESPIPGFHSGPTLLEQDELCIDHGRSGEVDQETGHCTSRSSSRPVSEPRIHSSQAGRVSASGGESETSESFCPKTPLQDGRGWHVEGPTAEERLVGFYRPEGCLPLYPDSRERQEVPTLPVERADIRVLVPPLRAQQCTQSFHKALKTSNGPPETTRYTYNNLSGRLVSNGSIKGRDGQPSGRNPTLLPTLGVCDQPGEICALPKSHHSILGLYCGFSSNGDLSTSKESDRHNQSLPSSTATRDPLSLRTVEADRPNVSHNAGSITGTIVLSKSAKDKNQELSRSHSFEAMVTLDDSAKEELLRWVHQLTTWNGRAILSQTPDLVVETDASLLGWGAVSEEVRTGGLWSEKERTQHINCLELMAGALAVRTFAKHKRNIHVRLRMDNKTAIFYINRMGGTRSQSMVQPVSYGSGVYRGG